MRIGDVFRRLSTNREKPPVKRQEMEGELAAPSPFSIRQPWISEEVATTLSPIKLASLVRDIKTGEANAYLTLAEEMEERDGHYRSVLGSRKNAISSLEYLVESGGDDEKAKAIADDVYTNIVRKPQFGLLVSDLLDALGKGYSVCEIIWKLDASWWTPLTYKWRDPRWFRYDHETGENLMLKEGAELLPLKPYKYVVHQPYLKSGLQIRSGLALPCAYYHMIKSFDLAGWAAFAETYGYPIRIGKYGRNASKKDIEVLKSAVRNIGTDVGAVVPESMLIEIVNGVTGNGNVTLYERLAEYADKQMSKAILGQTMSSDAEGGQYKGDLHNEIRLEIRESDADQIASTINRDLIIPYVQLNYGIQEEYPHLTIPVPRPEDIPGLVDAVTKLAPLGFKVKTEDLYYKLGLNRPAKEDDVLQSAPAPVVDPDLNRQKKSRLQLNAEQAEAVDDPVAELVDEAAGEWEQIASPLLEQIQQLAAECASYDELSRRLPSLLKGTALDAAIDRIALATFKAKALGDVAALEDEDV